MKTGIACLAISVGIVLYIYAACACHALNIHNDKTAILAAGVVAVVFAIFGILLLPL